MHRPDGVCRAGDAALMEESGRGALVERGAGLHYDTLFKTDMFWRTLAGEHVLLFQVMQWLGYC